MIIYGIDSGTQESSMVVIETKGEFKSFGSIKILSMSTWKNVYLWEHIRGIKGTSLDYENGDFIAIEKIIARKWSGKETSDAAIWSGIFAGVHLSRTRFITRARVRWELLHQRNGGDKEINKVLRDIFVTQIKEFKVNSHKMAALAVALTAYINPTCSNFEEV